MKSDYLLPTGLALEVRIPAVLGDRGTEVRLRGRSDVRELSAEAALAYWPEFALFGPEERREA